MSKSDSSEMQKRINLIYSMLLQGLQRKAIIQYCSKNYEISDRQVDEYLAKARQLMSDDLVENMDLKRSEILAQLNDLYNKSYLLEDYRECRNILAQITSILGVEAIKRTDITSDGKSINNLPTSIKIEIVKADES